MSTLAAILNRDPKPAGEIAPAVPRDLEKVINRCLRKDPERRVQYMADVKVALVELKEKSESGALGPPIVLKRSNRRRLPAPALRPSAAGRHNQGLAERVG